MTSVFFLLMDPLTYMPCHFIPPSSLYPISLKHSSSPPVPCSLTNSSSFKILLVYSMFSLLNLISSFCLHCSSKLIHSHPFSSVPLSLPCSPFPHLPSHRHTHAPLPVLSLQTRSSTTKPRV